MINKNKYLELLNATGKETNSEQVVQLMTYIYDNTPKSLFHYRRCSEQSIEAFRENKLFFNTASNFNDPYDCLVFCDKASIEKEIDGIGNEANKSFLCSLVDNPELVNSAPFQIPAEFIAKIKESINNGDMKEKLSSISDNNWTEIKNLMQTAINKNLESIIAYYQTQMPLVCLSEKYNNILMWAHYADNHKGFVVEYDSRSLQTGCNACPEGKDFKTCPNWQATRLMPILYTNQRYDATSYIVDSTLSNLFNSNGLQGLWDFRDCFAQYKINIYKHHCWDYEKEWRLQLYNINGKKEIKVKPVAIYLGCRIAKCYEDILVKYAQEQNIKVYKMNENPSKLKFGFTKKSIKI